VTADLAALAERAISQQVHPANWSYWVRQVMMAGPARDFIEAASPSAVLAIFAALPVSPTDGLDVERLAEVIHNEAIGSLGPWRAMTTARMVAKRIAAAYAEERT
jgi:hypothetical protein